MKAAFHFSGVRTVANFKIFSRKVDQIICEIRHGMSLQLKYGEPPSLAKIDVSYRHYKGEGFKSW